MRLCVAGEFLFSNRYKCVVLLCLSTYNIDKIDIHTELIKANISCHSLSDQSDNMSFAGMSTLITCIRENAVQLGLFGGYVCIYHL